LFFFHFNSSRQKLLLSPPFLRCGVSEELSDFRRSPFQLKKFTVDIGHYLFAVCDSGFGFCLFFSLFPQFKMARIRHNEDLPLSAARLSPCFDKALALCFAALSMSAGYVSGPHPTKKKTQNQTPKLDESSF